MPSKIMFKDFLAICNDHTVVYAVNANDDEICNDLAYAINDEQVEGKVIIQVVDCDDSYIKVLVSL